MANVVITGGSRGIGAAAVREFRRRGDRVWFFYAQSHEKAGALAEETGAAAVLCDVTDPQAVKNAFAALPCLLLNPAFADQQILGPTMVGVLSGLPLLLLALWLLRKDK